MKKTIEVYYEHETYKVKAKFCGFTMVKVSVYRLARPNWKIFRYNYLNWGSFNLVNYETAEKGVLEIATALIKKEQELNNSYYKFKKFMGKRLTIT